VESGLESVNDHEEFPVLLGDVGRFAKIDLFLLVLLVQVAVFSTVVRISVVDIGVTAVVESLERGSNRTESLIEILFSH
jgi:hypothetical protein